MRENTVSLGDVASRAGVSKATASKVFNGRSDVSPLTRERVSQAATELGYVPAVRPAAPGVAQVWVVFNRMDNAYSAAVLEGLLAEAHVLDAVVTITEWGSVGEKQPVPGSPAWIRRSQDRGAQAFVLVTTPVSTAHLDACRRRKTPLVVVDPISEAPHGTTSVGATNWRGGVQATEHLLALGHRRLACVGTRPGSTPARERLAGFRSAVASAGLDPNTMTVHEGDFVYADGLDFLPMLEQADRPTGIFAACDDVALGLLEAARQAGLRVPEDLSIVGFDDTFAARAASPQLTTVRQPLAEMGRMAMRAAVAGIRTDADSAPPVQLATTLIERGSTAPAPGS